MDFKELNKILGNIDLFLLDQILKGRFSDTRLLLDAGCGEGRNLKYFIENGYQVTGIDTNPEAINFARLLYRDKAEFLISSIESATLDRIFDGIICINVLHHAKDKAQFERMWQGLISMLNSGGFLFIRTLVAQEEESFTKDAAGNLTISNHQLKLMAKEYALEWAEPLKVESWDNRHLGIISLIKP